MTLSLSAGLATAAAVRSTALPDIARLVAPPTAVPIIALLIHVRGGSTRNQNAAPSTTSPTTLRQSLFRIPAPIRYFISGSCANVVFYFLERLLHRALYHFHFSKQELLGDWTEMMLPSWVNSATFFSAYMLQVPIQHYLHALLVYGLESINTPAKYYRTLGGMFSTLAVAAFGSTALNALLLSTTQLSKTAAFVVTLCAFSIINYFVIGWIVNASNKSSTVEVVISNQKKVV
ncbi:hypothetical protein FisN_13Hh070 [Fistulifera solaris]|uniref:Uncharacterized protein n=1 Tax=Fistulifera solaris TaxID=1519565 RepID=A0A1Z5KNC0_FISSO|nr:hypothetical protein FisN_13Hh070 [Fistulifera solaris]|eukprot:GAX27823.1 hypothetical protein FisN_13Hh070 [Fistulifera solaris]